MIAQELEVSLHMAFVEARQQRHEFITVEHLLMALLDNPSAAEVLRTRDFAASSPEELAEAKRLMRYSWPLRASRRHRRAPLPHRVAKPVDGGSHESTSSIDVSNRAGTHGTGR